MKYIKRFEKIDIEDIKIGDYITITDSYYNGQIPINCVKVTSDPYYNHKNDSEQMVNVDYITPENELDTSYLYMSQIGDFAAQEDIELFESILAANKYNL